LELKNTINIMVDKLTQFASEVTRVAQEVGTDGILGGKAEVKNVSGAWQDLTNNVNGMADNLTNQVRNIASVATAVANGDLGQKITVDAKGEILELKDTLNTMVDRLTQFASEVTRVAQEVGTDGILGGQAEVAGVTGAWGDLTRNVNRLANNLTDQVRDISRVTSAVAKGDLEQKITVEAQGEVLELKNTINSMTDTLSLFANQVTYVAKEVGDEGKLGGQADVPEAQGIWRNLTDNVNELADNLTRQIRAILTVVTDVTQGNLTGSIDVAAKGEVETLKNGLNQMILTLKETSDINNEQDWLKSNLSYFVRLMQGNSNLQALADVVITKVCTVLNVQHGVFYALESNFNKDIDKPMLYMLASYAFHERKSVANRFEIGQGLVGQAALEKKRILVHNIPGDYIQVSSGLGNAQPLTVVVLPVVFENELLGVLELGSFSPFTEISLNFLDQLMESLGIVANAVVASAQTESLLTESQSLSEELQKQQEELKNSNVKLETQAKNLQDSEAKLKNKQEELQQTNEELEEKSRVLADQKHEVESAKIQLEEKAQQLAISSKYKSEFLANMSHELRTPLNSLMVLSDGLRKNIDKNFTDKQVEKMATIHDSGIELLELINEILDLAKIEAGKMLVQVGDIFLQRIQNWAARGFNQMAENKGITFETELDPSLPKTILTDEKRLQQVIKNFISNAIKFTNKGQVTLSIYHAKTGWTQNNRHLNEASTVVAFSVTDSGIGIPADKHQVIFEAFQQADGSTSRKYGGTGLGLSISREIAHLLAGEIILESGVGKGSSFTLFIPHTYPEQADDDGNSRLLDYSGSNVKTSSLKDRSKINISPAYISDVKQLKVSLIGELAREVEDDRIAITASDRVVLIIENDLKFAKILLNKARKSGFKGIVATTGDSGLLCAQEYCPDAILLDIKLPIMNGWIVLDRIKHDAKIRHIPVHILSVDDVSQRSLEQGAISFLQKPIDDDSLKGIFVQIDVFQKQKVKQLLVVADNEKHRLAIVNLVDNGVVNVTAVATAKEAIKELKSSLFQCMVLALILPDENGLSLIESINKDPALINLPIIIYKGKDLTEEEEYRLNSVAETIMVKNVKSPERLIDETALFLHIVESNLPESKRQMLQQVHENDPQLWGRTILIVDDDVRNIFTLTSVFEAHDCVTLYAESGREAIEKLKNHPEIEIILMDIMMPVMNGYQTMQAIRKMEKYQSLPIIAVTAKAMMEDRQKCLDAGASDYIVKPVDTELLLSLVRVWLYK
ncbi:MAG: signal transduction histidine kinase/DNA-binding response OmpR family regulator, partial [Paraglaciecola sp.]